jgi:lipopolysaccharide export system permease protein
VSATRQKNIWIKSHRAIYFIKYFNPQNLSVSGVTLSYFDSDFRLLKRIDATAGNYQNGKWIFSDIMEQVLDKKSLSYAVQIYPHKAVEIDILPEDLKRVFTKSDEMNVAELFSYIREVESEGYDATTYRVDLHARFAFPVLSIIVCIIGIGIAVRRKGREGPSISIAFGAMVVFAYWVVHSFCLSLGYGGMLPPIVAAWISNVIFSCYAILNLINAE